MSNDRAPRCQPNMAQRLQDHAASDHMPHSEDTVMDEQEMVKVALENRWVKVAGGWTHVDADIHDYPFYSSLEELYKCELSIPHSEQQRETGERK